MSRRAIVMAFWAAVLFCWLPGGAEAEIFKWTDSNDRVHFTQDLNQVPARYRVAAEAGAQQRAGRSPIQIYSAPAKVAPSKDRSAGSRSARGSKQAYKIRVQKAGNSMRVNVRLNGRVNAPFIIDTGASDVVVPRWVVDELGLDLRGARTAHYSTANGMIEASLVTLDRVELGGASAEGVPAAVSDSMQTGLLGLSFFNRFNYTIDTARGLVTLVPNDLEAEGLIRGGRSEPDWRGEYANLSWRIRALEEKKRSTPSSRSRAHAAIKEEMAELDRQLRKLESEADEAHVPFAWRE
ncbi:MAG: TIGR02281 family clan AA aspartic protease [Myxococcota bacterium]